MPQHRSWNGIEKTNIRQIAEESGIARQTVYNYFKNKNALLAAAFQREGIKIGLAAMEHIAQFDSAEEQFIEAFLFAYDNLPKNPILAKVVEPGSTFFHTLGMEQYEYAQYGELVFADVFKKHPYLKAEAESISELWVRGIMSFLTIPGPKKKTREELKTFITLRLLPGLGLRAE